MSDIKVTKQQLIDYISSFYRENDKPISKYSLESKPKDELEVIVITTEGKSGLATAASFIPYNVEVSDKSERKFLLQGKFIEDKIKPYCEQNNYTLIRYAKASESHKCPVCKGLALSKNSNELCESCSTILAE